MTVFALRINEEEEKISKDYAKMKNMTVSELFRSSVLERIEADIDLTLYQEAMNEHVNSPSAILFDEMMKELNPD